MNKQAGEFRTIAENAWGWYNNPLSLGGIRPRGLLPLAEAYHVAMSVGRPLTQEDLKFLVQKDGEPVICDGCGKQFQPVKWAVINLALISAVETGLQFSQLNGEVRWAGSRIVKVIKGGQPTVLSFCGAFFFYDPTLHDGSGAEFFSVNRRSCLGLAYLHEENCDDKGKPRPIRSWDSAMDLVRRMEDHHLERVQEARHVRDERFRQDQELKLAGVNGAFTRQLNSWRRRR